jgi:integrase
VCRSTSEVAALALACGAQGDVVSLLAYTGLRFGELVGLRIEDVDLGAKRIRVRRSITQVGGKLTEGNPKTAAGRRSIPVPERVMPILSQRIAGGFPDQAAITSPNGSLLGLEKLEAVHPVAQCDRRDRSAHSSCTRPPARLRLAGPAGRRRSAYFKRRWAMRRSP